MHIGIRKEDKNDFEKRVPISPEQVKTLICETQAHVTVESSPIRAFKDSEYTVAGAVVSDEWINADLVIAVKEIPEQYFKKDGRYLFFSHTIKGQKDNMPMLKRLIELKATLFDYERLVDEQNKRLVFFGPFAGQAGMIDSLWTYGRWCTSNQISTVISEFKQALTYTNLEKALQEIQQIGKKIQTDGLPEAIVPFVIGFGGYGSVAKGAWQVLDQLPLIEISPDDLINFYQAKSFSNKHIYKVVFKEKDLVANRSGNNFSLEEYFQSPEKYQSAFSQYLPYLSIYMNCVYWTNKSPRFITKADIKQLYTFSALKAKLRVIGDISCDINGSVEFTSKATTPANPVFVYDVNQDTAIDGIEGTGPIVLAVDNLPCELPKESSTFFGNLLLPLLKEFSQLSSVDDLHLLSSPWQKAMILNKGQLTERFSYLKSHL